MSLNPTRIPYLDFAFISDDGEKEFSLIHQDNSYHSKMPSWVTSFNYVRRAYAFGAGSWSLALSDPTFTLMDILHSIFAGKEVSEDSVIDTNSNFMNQRFANGENIVDPLGRVRFTYGHRDSTGIDTLIAGPVDGWIEKISPSIVSKHKLTIHMQGSDRNPLDRSTSIPALTSELFVNTTLGDSLNKFLAGWYSRSPVELREGLSFTGGGNIMRPVWTPYEIEYESPELENLIVNDEDIAAGNSSSLGSGLSATGNFSFTINNYFQHLQLLLSNHHIVFVEESRPRSPSKGSVKVIRVQTLGRILPTTPTYFINTTSQDFVASYTEGPQYGTAVNDSRVISFDASIDPLLPNMLGSGSLTTDSWDENTLEVTPINVDASNNESMVVENGMTVMPVLAETIYPEGTQCSLNMVRRKMSYLQGWLAKIPYRASMRCQFIDSIVNPFEYINVFVATPQGQAFFTSGYYMVTEVADSVTPGRILTTYQMVRSGDQFLSNIVPNFAKVVNNDSQ